jgi:transposase
VRKKLITSNVYNLSKNKKLLKNDLSRLCVEEFFLIYNKIFFDNTLLFMKMAEQLKTREFIIRLFQENRSRSQKTIAKMAKVSQGTVSNVLNKFETDLSLDRKKGSGRKKDFANPELVKRVSASFEKNLRISNRKMAAKVKCSEKTVRKIKAEVGVRYYKVQTVPDRNAVKNLEARSRAKKLKYDFFQNLNAASWTTKLTCFVISLNCQDRNSTLHLNEEGLKKDLGPKKIQVPQKIPRLASDLHLRL